MAFWNKYKQAKKQNNSKPQIIYNKLTGVFKGLTLNEKGQLMRADGKEIFDNFDGLRKAINGKFDTPYTEEERAYYREQFENLLKESK